MAAGGDREAGVMTLLQTAEACRRAGRLSDARDALTQAAKAAEAAGDERGPLPDS